MTKEAAIRSYLRRSALVKAAYNSELGAAHAIAGAYRPGIVNAGLNTSVNSALGSRRPATATVQAKTTAPAQPRQAAQANPAPEGFSAFSGAGRREPMYKKIHVQAPKDYQGAGVLDFMDKATSWPTTARNWFNSRFGGGGNQGVAAAQKPKPVMGATATSR